MNPLDELLSTTSQVDDTTPAGLRHGRAALDSAIADVRNVQSSAPRPEPFRRPGRPPRRRTPWLVAACTAAAAAAVAGTTVTVLSNHSGVTGAAGEKQGSLSPEGGAPRSGTSASGTETTAAVLLRAAGQAAGEQQGGWPNAAYWHVASVYVRNGKTYHRDILISHYGNGVLEDNGVNSGPLDLGPALFPAGGKGLTWAQLYALPTDPAKLEPVLQSDIKGAGPNPTAELYTVVGDLLRESPAPPALRKALYEIAATIPGVKLVGDYKDALGQTGTAVERDGETLVIDPTDGQLLADIQGNPEAGISCGGGCVEYGVAYMYVSEGPATSAPAVPR